MAALLAEILFFAGRLVNSIQNRLPIARFPHFSSRL
jgi:hypothetical protein